MAKRILIGVICLALVFFTLFTIVGTFGADGKVLEGLVEEDITLTKKDSPWYLRDITLKDCTMTIEPGSVVRQNAAFGFTNQGTIIAEGTSKDPISFEAYMEPGYENTTAAWYTGTKSIFRNCTLISGGFNVMDGTIVSDFLTFSYGINVIGSEIFLNRCYISYGRGLVISNPSKPLSNITLVDCIASDCTEASFSVQQAVQNIRLLNCKAIKGDGEGFKLNGVGADSSVYLEDCKAILCKSGFDIALDGNFTLKHCVAYYCDEIGFVMRAGVAGDQCYLIECLANECDIGASLMRPNHIIITRSSFIMNNMAIKIWDRHSGGYTIWNNNFRSNERTPDIQRTGSWDNGSHGNYWERYTGTDADSDGIGDTSYEYDNYPLMEPQDVASPFAVCTTDVVTYLGRQEGISGRLTKDYLYADKTFTFSLHLPSGTKVWTEDDLVYYKYNEVGLFLVELEVSDRLGKKSRDSTLTWVRDNLPPMLVGDLTPSVTYTGENVTISCKVSDNIAVLEAWVEYAWGESLETVRMNLNRSAGDIWWGNLYVPLTQKDSIYYSFGYSDKDGNTGESGLLSILVHDDDAPSVVPFFPWPYARTGEDRALMCDAVDNWEISTVNAEYWFGYGRSITVEMNYLEEHRWSCTVPIPIDNLDNLHVTFKAKDSSGNLVSTDPFMLTILDSIEPTIEDLTKRDFHRGDEARFVASAWDNIGVTNVSLQIKLRPDDDWTSIMMVLEDGYYVANVFLEDVVSLSLYYNMVVEDSSGNEFETDTYEISLRSAVPRITTVPQNETLEGDTYEQVIEIEDPDGLSGEHTISLKTDAEWLVVNLDTFTLWGTPGEEHVGTTSVEVTVTDSEGEEAVLRYNLTVVPVDVPPSLEISDPQDGVKVGKSLSVTGKATDDDDRIDMILYRMDGGEWTETPGSKAWTIEVDTENLKAGDHTLEIKVSDGKQDSEPVSLLFSKEKEKQEEPGFGFLAGLLALLASACAACRWSLRDR